MSSATLEIAQMYQRLAAEQEPNSLRAAAEFRMRAAQYMGDFAREAQSPEAHRKAALEWRTVAALGDRLGDVEDQHAEALEGDACAGKMSDT